MKFIIVIALGNKCPFLIIWEQYNSPRWELPVGIVQVTIVLGGIVWGSCPGGAVVRVAIILGNCPRGNCPRTRVIFLRHHGKFNDESNHLLFRGQISNATGTNYSRR